MDWHASEKSGAVSPSVDQFSMANRMESKIAMVFALTSEGSSGSGCALVSAWSSSSATRASNSSILLSYCGITASKFTSIFAAAAVIRTSLD